jgi:photosystem II stability/assembly factor-like uncharacterized protein
MQVSVAKAARRAAAVRLEVGGLRLVASLLASSCVLGCTFYTSCPTGNSGSTDTGPISGVPRNGEWEAAVPDLSEVEVSCGPVDYLAASPVADLLVASVPENGLWASDDGGDAWRQLGQGEESVSAALRTSAIVFDPDDANVFWQAGGDEETPGLLQTRDGGETFSQLADITNLQGLSVDFTDPERRTLLATGRGEQRLLLSRNGGESFGDITSRLPDGLKHCGFPLVLDADVMLLGCGGGDDPGKPRILRSVNAGRAWEAVYEEGVGAEPLLAADGTVYWLREARRGLLRSVDRGATWQEAVGADVLVPKPLSQLSDGSIAGLSSSEVIASVDRGATWSRISPSFTDALGFVSLGARRQLFVYSSACDEALPEALENGVLRFSL